MCGHGRPPMAAAFGSCEKEGSSNSDAACSAEGGACLEGVGAADGCMVRLAILLHAACPAWLLCALTPLVPVQISWCIFESQAWTVLVLSMKRVQPAVLCSYCFADQSADGLTDSAYLQPHWSSIP